MFTLVYGFLAIVTWSAFFYKLKDLARDWRNKELRLLCLAIATFAAPFVFASPAIYVRVDALLGIPNIATLIIYTSVAICNVSFLALLVSWATAQSAVRLWHRILVGYAGATIIAMALLFSLGRVDDAEHPIDFDVHYADTPYITEFLLVYKLLFTIGMVGLIRLCWRYAKAVNKPWMRRGLRFVTVGAAFGLGYSLPKLVSLVWERLGSSPLDYVNSVVAPMSASVSAFLFAVGFTMPAWGVGWDRARTWVMDYRSYQRLHPLWSVIAREFPDLVLYPPASRLARWAARDVTFLLGRQIIEIRDGQLALRPYYHPDVADTARQLGEARNLTGDRLKAVVEAAQIAAALKARASGTGTPGRETVTPHDPAEGDLREEGAWLALVADAFHRSPIVRAALSQPDALVDTP
ncbi:MAB_1171c family putative transporter [Streptomyces sp. 7N604]|uniref:MAB_1171c family putative transporter n=1 Tax=Streptomyces sp. 7N604 TaxID=3457415 RepID=UPI003FCF48C0